VPANFQRFLPLILIIFLLLFVLPTILKHHSSKGLTSADLSKETIATTTKVDALQQQFRTAHKGYTGSVADLLAMDHALGKPLGDGVVIALDVSTDKQTYYAQVASTVISLTRAREGGKVIAKSCTVIKSGGGVECPQPPTKTTSTSTSTSTSTTTTTSG
jgi:hypothetical protein